MTTGYGTPGMEIEDGRCLSSQAALPSSGLSRQEASQAKPAAANAQCLERALGAFPLDAIGIIEEMGDGEYCQTGPSIAASKGIPLKRVQAIHRALRTLGFADFGTLQREDDGVPVGSGYWITRDGESLRAGFDALAQVIDARRAATAKTGAVGDESAVPQGCAQTSEVNND